MAALEAIYRDMALSTLMEDLARKKREQAAWRKKHEGKAKARGEMRATPRNAVVGLAAEGALSLKDLANSMGRLPDKVPMLGGLGAGDLLMGEGGLPAIQKAIQNGEKLIQNQRPSMFGGYT